MKLEIMQLLGYDCLKMPSDERAKLMERRAKIEARLKQLAIQDQKQRRKDETRRKVIAGALVLEHAERKADFAAELHALLNAYVTRPQDRALFDFLKDRVPDANQAPPPAPSESFTAAAVPPEPPRP